MDKAFIELPIESLNVEVEYQYHRGDNYPITPVTVSPPDSEYVEVFRVWLVNDKNQRINILPFLSETLIQYIEKACVDV